MHFLFGILIFAASFSLNSALASDSSRFTGFSSGQSSAGILVGVPVSLRYQRWFDWQSNMFFDVGYQTDEFIMADANYAYYFLREDDRWKMDNKVGIVMYSVYGGVSVGSYVGKADDEDARLGLRLGGAFEYLLPNSNWSARLELAPVVYLSGKTAAGIQGGVAVMYHFGADKPKKQRKAMGSSAVEGGIDQSIIDGSKGADLADPKKADPKKVEKKKGVAPIKPGKPTPPAQNVKPKVQKKEKSLEEELEDDGFE